MADPVAETTDTGTAAACGEAKTRFNAALDEARAGASALGAEARAKGDDWTAEAKVKAADLAVEGKARASSALSGLSQLVAENAPAVDEKLGSKYGDYARSASRGLQDTADRLDAKSIEDLGNDAKEFVRTSPGTAIGIAAVTGFLIARLFRK
ncbi:hypothetical protein GRI97_17895 [Altererythrobacter xixiisoli]|uniref:DUF883 domain-containing protein n=1 Tax=Croceibacterium xixiisoli TaxID=1476466 RepID=A0A6I4TXZ0_9SPHN|nr:hypothetical protein [Croceibacterium xixiisoli]MXP00865.1 hypothetical protein [Croceibacterium xixiisoli]